MTTVAVLPLVLRLMLFVRSNRLLADICAQVVGAELKQSDDIILITCAGRPCINS